MDLGKIQIEFKVHPKFECKWCNSASLLVHHQAIDAKEMDAYSKRRSFFYLNFVIELWEVFPVVSINTFIEHEILNADALYILMHIISLSTTTKKGCLTHCSDRCNSNCIVGE